MSNLHTPEHWVDTAQGKLWLSPGWRGPAGAV